MDPRNAVVAVIVVALVLAGCSGGGTTTDSAAGPDESGNVGATADEPPGGDDESGSVGATADEPPGGDDDRPTGGDAATGGDGAGTDDGDQSAQGSGARELSITTPDGERLGATVLGSGANGIVLAHMRGRDRTTWLDFAEEAARDGYHVLAFDFRGYGSSTGARDTELDVDVLAAINALADEGATRIVAMGASMGGTAVINVASTADLAGAVSVSAPADFLGLPALDVAVDVGEPLLVVAAENDQPYADVAIGIDDRAPASQLRLFSGNAHGTNLFGTHGDELTELLLDFAADRLS